MHDDDPIPLEESSGSPIIPLGVPAGESADFQDTGTSVRIHRKQSRRSCTNTRVCFSPEFDSGKVDPTECPVINISAGGFALEFDRRLVVGQRGTITYRAENGRPVNVGCVTRQCIEQMDGLFRLGLKLDRKLQPEEMRPLRVAVGRDLAPGIRARKLKRAITSFGDLT